MTCLSLALRALWRASLPAALLASCASVPLTQTGFLGDYSEIKPAPEHQVWGVPDTVHLYRSPELDVRAYDAVLVDPTEWHQGGTYEPNDENVAWLQAEFSKCMEKVLGREFEVITEPREGALRVRPALTAANPSNVLLNAILAVVAVPLDQGGISGEIEIVDAMSGERMLAMTARREGNIFLVLESVFIWGHARHGMYKWGLLLNKLLQPSR